MRDARLVPEDASSMQRLGTGGLRAASRLKPPAAVQLVVARMPLVQLMAPGFVGVPVSTGTT